MRYKEKARGAGVRVRLEQGGRRKASHATKETTRPTTSSATALNNLLKPEST
ncbi:MAG: hypothetical protein QXI37_02555 [Thermoprotei archaeon]